MKKAEILKTEIENGIAKIEKLESNQKEEVHKIYSEIYKKYFSLTEDDFFTVAHYKDYLNFRLIEKPHFENELSDLLNLESDLYTSDNFFQIKKSLERMMPNDFTK